LQEAPPSFYPFFDEECMTRPRVADGGDGLHIWMVAANILSSGGKTTRGSPPTWGLDEVQISPRHKNSLLQTLPRASELDGFFKTT